MEITCRVYRPRDPRKTPLYGLLESLYERVKGAWEERFERCYGFWRGLVDEAVARYLACGLWQGGLAGGETRPTCRPVIPAPPPRGFPPSPHPPTGRKLALSPRAVSSATPQKEAPIPLSVTERVTAAGPRERMRHPRVHDYPDLVVE